MRATAGKLSNGLKYGAECINTALIGLNTSVFTSDFPY